MKRLAILLPLFVLSFGCQKAERLETGRRQKPSSLAEGERRPVGRPRRGGGAGQAVRKAAARTVNDVELNELAIDASPWQPKRTPIKSRRAPIRSRT